VKQVINDQALTSVEHELLQQLDSKEIASHFHPGQRVAIAVGSRGIDSLSEIISCLVSWLKNRQVKPFLVPAMGSHGSATAAGQLAVSQSHGITEEKVKASIISSMETVQVGCLQNGAPVFMDKNAYQAEGIILVNRIKPHTAMSGPVQSGLLKMLTVGLGKQDGAVSMHRYGLEQSIPEAAGMLLQKTPVLLGIGIIENAFSKPYRLEVLPSAAFFSKEPLLLQEASKLLPGIPFSPVDILFIRYMGKDISGSGMDTNVVGRWRRTGGRKDKEMQFLAALDLTAESAGNAYGVGMADFITRALYNKIDFETTYTNALTSRWIDGVKIPMVLADEKEVFEKAFRLIEHEDTIRAVLINSTSDLERIWVTTSLKEEVHGDQSLDITGTTKVSFNEENRLLLTKEQNCG